MTVIEREQTEVITQTEQRARVLEAAALEIEVRGWCRDVDCDEQGRVCAVGAINCALGFDPESKYAGGAFAVWGDGIGDIPMAYNTNNGYMLPAIPAFNDLRAGDSSEVTFLLRWRAEEIRDGR